MIGAIVAFIVSNYLSYVSGRSGEQALLIETMSNYRNFYSEVQKDHKIACDESGNLRGLYLTQFNSMLPVIKGEIQAPYDNPCPSLSQPMPPKLLKINFCESWETWDDFINDPDPHMSLNFPSGVLYYPLGEEWRSAIIEWNNEITRLKENKCPDGNECTFTATFDSKKENNTNKSLQPNANASAE